MTEQDIVDKVRVILNEAGEENTLTLLSEDTVKLSDYIRKSIPDAVTLVQRLATGRVVNWKASLPDVTAAEGGCALKVPDDFVRVISVKMKSWKRPCHVAQGVSSEEYKRQFNQFTRNGVNKPLCFIRPYNGGEKILLFPFTSGDTVEYFSYEAKYSSSDGLSVGGDSPMALAVCYTTASIVYSIFENKHSADVMMQLASKYLVKP